MNVAPINHLTNLSASTLPAACTSTPTVSYPHQIYIRIRALHLITQKNFNISIPSFNKIIDYLDQPLENISYSECEHLCLMAFNSDFSDYEIDLLLTYFFTVFDPTESLICYQKITDPGTRLILWKQLTSYLCSEYIGFTQNSFSIQSILSHLFKDFDADNSILKKVFLNDKTILEKKFEEATNELFTFSLNDKINTKLLLISYAALLIAALKKGEEAHRLDFAVDTDFTLQMLFEEIIVLLIEPLLEASNNTVHINEFEIDKLNPNELKKLFLDEFTDFLIDPHHLDHVKDIATLYEVIESCSFSDYEIKRMTLNLLLIKKMSSLDPHQLTF